MEKIETERGQGDVEYRRPERARICRESPLMPRSAPMLRAGGWGCSSPDRLPRGEQSRRAVGDDLFLAFWRCFEGRKTGAGEADFLYLILKG